MKTPKTGLLTLNNLKQHQRLLWSVYVKFDICDRFDMIEEMDNILKFLKQQDKNKYQNNIISFTSILMAKKGDVDGAKSYFEKNIYYYTSAAKEKFKSKLERYRRTVP